MNINKALVSDVDIQDYTRRNEYTFVGQSGSALIEQRLMRLRMIFPGGMSDVLSGAIDDFNSEVSLMEGYLEGKFSKAARESYTERIGSLQKALKTAEDGKLRASCRARARSLSVPLCTIPTCKPQTVGWVSPTIADAASAG